MGRLEYHIVAFFLGFLLDLLLGDPDTLPHPVRLIGKWTAFLERRLLRKSDGRKEEAAQEAVGNGNREVWQGRLLVSGVLFFTVMMTVTVLEASYLVHPLAGLFCETVMTYQILAVKCLKTESGKVYEKLQDGDIHGARKAVSMIVGRDTDCLDEGGIIRAAVETVAENTSDGVIAPMLYTALGGPVLGFFYKAVNTMDSMVGYKNDRYLYFGRAAAKLDDVVNFLPARISAHLMVAASFLCGRDFDEKRAYRIYKRDRRKHASPNSAQTEAVCAGALGIRLGGDASYFGKRVSKPYIGDACRQMEPEDIRKSNRLLYMTAWLCEGICLMLMGIVKMALIQGLS